jgi:inosine/xanthosine triphosphatase
MIINIGSQNQVKVEAVKEILEEYPFLKEAETISFSVESGVSDQPKSIEETIKGAKNRARESFKDCTLSVGHESGIIKMPETKTGYTNVDVCAIYDGKQFHLGFSPMFEYPIEATKLVIEQGMDFNRAFLETGLTNKERMGNFEGAVGFLTKGRMPRKEVTKIAMRMALIHLEFSDLY